jgi:hypothetical protein
MHASHQFMFFISRSYIKNNIEIHPTISRSRFVGALRWMNAKITLAFAFACLVPHTPTFVVITVKAIIWINFEVAHSPPILVPASMHGTPVRTQRSGPNTVNEAAFVTVAVFRPRHAFSEANYLGKLTMWCTTHCFLT